MSIPFKIKKIIALKEIRLNEEVYFDWGLLVYQLKKAILEHKNSLSSTDKEFIRNKIIEHNLALGKKVEFLKNYQSLLKT